ncbi:type VI secretion system-associated protein TagF [Thalassococcus sp. S3]|uniref:type VI secretion system-associated protein TagF n=1 Tax=Thalassococcus sp. S3 TaxID=2017482 RepID=UPI0013EE5002|nr:type VI secretion system-associated protein TagF [Thalassococcus sp. S3]
MTLTSGSSHFHAFGKLPARADFVDTGLSAATRRAMDVWLQDGIAESQREYGTSWRQIYLEAPIWRFILPWGMCGPVTILGVISPSHDSVGRCYPLLMATEIPSPVNTIGLIAGSNRWFGAVEALALDARDPTFDSSELYRRLLPRWRTGEVKPIRTFPTSISGREGLAVELPMLSAGPAMAHMLCREAPAERGLWWTAGSTRVPPMLAIIPKLTSPLGFTAFLDGKWTRHGWDHRPLIPDAPTPETGAPAVADWDREA